MRKNRIVATVMALSLAISGIMIEHKISKAEEVNQNEILPNIVDSNMDIPVTETNAFGEVIGEDKGITVSLDYDKMYAEGEDKITSWSYRHKFELKQDAYVDITSMAHVFTYNFVGDVYTYLSSSPDHLGIQLHSAWGDGDLDTRITTQKALAKGTYYVTLVLDKGGSAGASSDFPSSPFYTINVKQTVPTNLSTNKVHLLNLNADAYVLEENVTGKTFLPNYPESNSVIYKITIPYECTLKFKGVIRANNGNYYYNTVINLLDSNLNVLKMVQQSDSYKYPDYNTMVYEQKVKAGEYYIKMTRGYAEATLPEMTYWTENVVLTSPTPVPTPVPNPIKNPAPAQNPNTTVVTNSITAKTMPTAKINTIGNNKKVKIAFTKKIKGIDIKFKYKGKTYKAKTNKKGIATIKLKKALKNKSTFTVTYSKSGYKTYKKTYRKIVIL